MAMIPSDEESGKMVQKYDPPPAWRWKLAVALLAGTLVGTVGMTTFQSPQTSSIMKGATQLSKKQWGEWCKAKCEATAGEKKCVSKAWDHDDFVLCQNACAVKFGEWKCLAVVGW